MFKVMKEATLKNIVGGFGDGRIVDIITRPDIDLPDVALEHMRLGGGVFPGPTEPPTKKDFSVALKTL